ncbi:NUDIX hydrolase [Spirosoma taeanense]|uniref:NUDIX hydrolase n=1 Tax=Spirosoma taeanense TaxID=2735870 RepID=A0A6M5Y9D5_9BACT|nr:NUDIX hydrolase [Spirosoma taeanense]QJW90094.1 NUDIX hydrolase [Spirosoma taeanense]
MHRQPLLSLLHQHLQHHRFADANEQAMTQETIMFVEQHPDCFERTLLVGHVTGSAWIIGRDRGHSDEPRVVLIHHRKLDRWFQPGGHADGDPDVAAVALREAQEETGLTSLQLVSPAIFDVDIHSIPALDSKPAHLHYDIRFLLEADPEEPFGITDEVQNIRWFSLKEANSYAKSESIFRMIQKML